MKKKKNQQNLATLLTCLCSRSFWALARSSSLVNFLLAPPMDTLGVLRNCPSKNPFILNMKSLIMHWMIFKILDYEIICIIGKWSSKNGWLSVYVRIENKSTAKKICLHKLKLDRLMFRVWALNILSRFGLLCLRLTKYKAIIPVMNRPKGKMMR